jgi:hypothetical protein
VVRDRAGDDSEGYCDAESGVITPELAELWFSIAPGNLDKIIPMPKVA